MKKAKVINCHELSIRRDVTDPSMLKEIVATLKVGDRLLVDDSRTYWSWNDRAYYWTSLQGYAAVECLEVYKSK